MMLASGSPPCSRPRTGWAACRSWPGSREPSAWCSELRSPACSASISPSLRSWRLAITRGAATRRAVGLTAASTVAITIGVLTLRSGDLGAFLRSVGIGERRDDSFGNAASWNERLIDAYVGGRVFLDNPILGTGWHGQLPPDEYVRFLDDARARFPDAAARATSRPCDGVHPAADVRPGAVRARDRRRAALPRARIRRRARRRAGRCATWPRDDPDEPAAYLPAAWVGALAGGLAGAALFGGVPLAAIFWLTIGVAAVAPSLVGRRSRGATSNAREPFDHPRDRAPERRRGRPARAPARARAGPARSRRRRRRGHARARARSRWSTSPTSSACSCVKLPVLQRELSPRADSAAIVALRRLIRKRRPDVLHTHTAKAGATGRLAALTAGSARPRAVVHTYHGHVLSGYFSRRWERVFRWIERALALHDRARSSPSATRCETISSASASRPRDASPSSLTASTCRRGATQTR